MYGQPNQGVSEAEIRGALEPTLDKAQGNNFGRLPANADNLVEFDAIKIDRSSNTKSPLNGCLYVAFDVKVVQSSKPDVAPAGAAAGFMFPGLDSRQNNGSLAQSSQADMRRCIAAFLGINPEAPPPPIPQPDGTVKQNATWTDVVIFCKNFPHNLKGKRVRVITGSPKPTKSGGEFLPMQFFPVQG